MATRDYSDAPLGALHLDQEEAEENTEGTRNRDRLAEASPGWGQERRTLFQIPLCTPQVQQGFWSKRADGSHHSSRRDREARSAR
jgi:hypothetical protein